MASGKTVLDDEKLTASESKKPHDNPLRAMFDGGNSRHIEHPPFTFAPVEYAPGELTAVGYTAGKPAVKSVRRTPGKPAKLKLETALEGRSLAADGADAIFVYATVCDALGTPVPDAATSVDFAVSGAAQLVSPATVPAEAGIATVLIRSSGITPGVVVLSATAPGLANGHAKLNVSY
jgi:beta-galactosidase